MVKITLVIDLDEKVDNFDDFEGTLIKKIRQEVILAVSCYPESLDEELRCQFERDHLEYTYHGKVSRTVKFYYGLVLINCRCYRCRGHKDVYMLDTFLPIN
jgi:hypothetical protein